MYRGALRIPSTSLKTSASYSTAARSSLCYLRPSTSSRPRHFSTPAHPSEDKKISSTSPDEKPLLPEADEDAAHSTAEPITLSSSPPSFDSSTSSNPADPVRNTSADQFNSFKERMQELTTDTLKQMRVRGDEFTTRVAKTFSKLGAELNRVTGYEEIEILKRKVVEQEGRILAEREAARAAKEAYENAVLQRSKSQREVNDLLQRKSQWTDEDVLRFTTLVREDHTREHEEARAKNAAHAAEDAVEREFGELMRVILSRYHEEQAWSDKIRSAATYGQLAALALNLAVFVLAIVLVEPWKRRRLAQTFERKVEEMGARTELAFEERTSELKGRLDEQAKALATLLETVHLANQVDVSEILAIERSLGQGRGAGGEEEEGGARTPPPYPHEERIPGVLPKPRTDGELVFVVTASAAAAGLLGWLARSWSR
ncbi:hypothetical protein GSI_15296 [Ganoderma sinense ZZ0214-1]|uniref:Sensitive to high expression protein 9, mitochondrial n=1 Tax=Ganoderma sinense ZZ0214-1 TaxID=1077348 RepID=A0A2G8RM66_9APHY|nr:hypothetical protein GSI_15296 [Ganoderma sinense ZZ0214-1]